VYALVKLTRQGANGNRRRVLYGVCGNRRLLEKIRAGQEHPEEWCVTGVGSAALYQHTGTWRKIG